jgi:hypothetical protein
MAFISPYEKAYAAQARKLCELGATDVELADFFGVTFKTIYTWKHKHKEFRAALKAGKEDADERVVRSLYHRAVGYEQEDTKVFIRAKEPVYATYRARIPPDVKAAIFWLKNRRPTEWRERREVEHIGDGGITRIERVIVDPDSSDA